MRIGTTAGTSSGGAAARAPRKSAHDPGFAVPGTDVTEAPPAGDGNAALASTQTVTTIDLEGAAPLRPDATSDLAAAQHGQDVLQALSGIHLGLLDAGSETARETLASLAATVPTPSDPKLAAVLRAIAQRAAIELARP